MNSKYIKSGAVGLSLAALLFAGCSETSTSTAQMTRAGQPIPAQTAQSEAVDLDDAKVAEVSYQTLDGWMNEADKMILDSEASATTEADKEKVAELKEKAEELNEDLAAIAPEDMPQRADEDLTKEVMELQVEATQMASPGQLDI